MDRLTKRHESGHVGLDAEGSPTEIALKLPAALDRLAAYEDTDFTPADIKDMRNELCLKCGDYKNANKGACDGCRWRKCYE